MTGRIACVFAHPDDETFAVGGTLAHYSTAGVGCDLFCATDGDAGRSSGVPVSSRAELAALRRSELQHAARVLGIERLVWGGLGDGTLHEIDPTPLIGDIVRFVREQRPAIVVTFGPEGAPNAHRDHRAISRAATAAFFLAAIPTEYADQLSEIVQPHQAARLFYVAWEPPPPAAELKAQSVRATAAVPIADMHERKLAAFMTHTTQRDHYDRFVTLGLTYREYFALAAGAPQPRPMLADLFEGLADRQAPASTAPRPRSGRRA